MLLYVRFGSNDIPPHQCLEGQVLGLVSLIAQKTEADLQKA